MDTVPCVIVYRGGIHMDTVPMCYSIIGVGYTWTLCPCVIVYRGGIHMDTVPMCYSI